jgi:DNA-binding PucR family transcriptional regulator
MAPTSDGHPPPLAADDQGTVTLRDLLAVTDFGLGLVTGTEQLDRPIRWAHSTELLDPRPYLRGDELVLTVGTALVDQAACGTFVANVKEAGAAALGYGVGDVTASVPPALVRASRDARLPLLTVPPGMPFLAITELLADRRAEARAARGQRISKLVAELLDAMAADRPLGDLLTRATAGLGGALALLDDHETVLVTTHHPVGRALASAPVEGVGRLVWWPQSEGDAPPGADALGQVAQVLGLHRHERDLELAQSRAELGRLLRLVVDGRADADALADLLEPAGIDPGRVTPVAWPATAAPLVSARLSGALTADLGDASITLTNHPEEAEQLAAETALPCGLGDTVDLAGLRHAVPESVAALALSRRRGTPTRADDLTSFDGLLEQQPAERLAPFAAQLIAPLADHDARHGTQLLSTMRAFLEGDGAVNATARELFLHPNSLRHRLGRIHDLTGRNPLVFDDRIALAVGLWAWDRRGLRGGQVRARRA